MTVADAFATVLDLARQNLISDEDMAAERARQTEACDMLEDLAVNEFGDDGWAGRRGAGPGARAAAPWGIEKYGTTGLDCVEVRNAEDEAGTEIPGCFEIGLFAGDEFDRSAIISEARARNLYGQLGELLGIESTSSLVEHVMPRRADPQTLGTSYHRPQSEGWQRRCEELRAALRYCEDSGLLADHPDDSAHDRDAKAHARALLDPARVRAVITTAGGME
jgi:hypothetical protein